MSKKITLGKAIGIFLTLFVALTVLLPILWLFVSSFKTDVGVISFPPTFFPKEWTLKQYLYVEKSIPIFSMTKSTVIFAGGVTILSVLFDSMAGYAFGIYMMKSFFQDLPKSIEESGRMDGMSEFRIYRSLMLPLCKPALVSLAVFHFMNNWNDLLYPLMLTSSASKRTLSAGLAVLVGNKVIKYGPTLAATMISLIPLLLLYSFCQNYFVEGIATSGAKE